MLDFARLSAKQRHVLGMIAINEDAGHHPKTLESLLNKQLIERQKQLLSGRFPVRIWRYSVPIHVHIAWCQWCSEQPEEEE